MRRRYMLAAAQPVWIPAVLAALHFTGAAFGQPFYPPYPPYVDRVGNSASYYSDEVPGGGIAQGSLMVLFGWGIGPDHLVQNSGFPLPAGLGGTSVKVTVNGVTVTAPMVYTSYEQAAAILPSSTPVGRGTLVLTNNQLASYPVSINVVGSSFGIYSLMSSGIGQGVITTPDYQVRTLARSFQPNDSLILWGTGLGAISGDDGAAPPAATNFAGVEVYVGGQRASVFYAGRSGCCAALDQINFVVPSGVEGCSVPVAVVSGGVTSNFVSMPVATGGGPCLQSVGLPADLLRSAQSGGAVNVAAIALGPVPVLQSVGFSYLQELSDRFSAALASKITEQQASDILHSTPKQRQRMILDLIKKSTPKTADRIRRLRALARLAESFDQQGAGGAFGRLTSLSRVVNGYSDLLPPPGTCSVYSESVAERDNWRTPKAGLDAGPELVLSGPVGTRSLPRAAGGRYQTSLGGGFNGRLPAGTYTVSSAGGADVGRFTASLTISGELQWTNMATTSVVSRSQPLEVTWTGGPSAGYVVFGGSAGGSGSSFRLLACVEEARKGRLSVPGFVLGALPATRYGKLFLGSHPFQNPFPASGLDAAFIADLNSDNRDVEFR